MNMWCTDVTWDFSSLYFWKFGLRFLSFSLMFKLCTWCFIRCLSRVNGWLIIVDDRNLVSISCGVKDKYDGNGHIYVWQLNLFKTVLGLPMIYGDVTTVPRYGKPLAISLIVIITFSSDTWGKNIPPPPSPQENKKKEEKVNFFRVRTYSITPPPPNNSWEQDH